MISRWSLCFILCCAAYTSSLRVNWMCAFVYVFIPILEIMVALCALPAPSYLYEVVEDGSVLAGLQLELELPVGATISY